MDPALTFVNMGAGGNSSAYGVALLADAIGPNGAGWATDHPDQAIFRTVYNDSQLVLGGGYNSESFKSPFISQLPDLVVVGFGANSVPDEAIQIETIVREFRRRGVEVALLTENPRSFPTPFLRDTSLIRSLADAQDCAIVDSFAYVEEGVLNGLSTYTDEVHQNAAGQRLYAAAIRSVLNDLALTPSTNTPAMDRVLSTQATRFPLGRIPNTTLYQYDPSYTTGGRIAAVDASLSLPVVMGHRPASNAVVLLEPGQVATYAASRVLAVDIVVENQPKESGGFEITTQFGAFRITTNAVVGAVVPLQVWRAVDDADLQAISGAASFFSDWKNPVPTLGLRITCTSGRIRLGGVVFHTFKGEDIPFDSMKTTGLWSQERSALDLPNWLFSDASDATVTLPFVGNGIEVWLYAGNGAGIVNASLDGVKVGTSHDLFRASGGAPLLYSLKLFPGTPTASVPFSSQYGPHVLTLTQAGVNAGADPTEARRRRLALYGAQALDTR